MKVTAIVPAYNEEESLPHVLRALSAARNVDHVLVVSDGSTDKTASVARNMGAEVLELQENHGKARAMYEGLGVTQSPYVLFIDGDILSLKPEMIERLVEPVTKGELAMNVGVRNHGLVFNKIQRNRGPLLSGNRCMRREVFEQVPEEFVEGFKIETALNWVCRRNGLKYSTVALPGIFHIVKERKRGYVAGFLGRIHMYLEVLFAYLTLTYGDHGKPLELAPRGVKD